MYPEKNVVQKGLCTPMFITALFTVAKTLKQIGMTEGRAGLIKECDFEMFVIDAK